MRFAVSLDNVAVVLSGMNAIGQLEDNVQNCSKIDGLTKEEINAINKVVEILHSKGAVPCTACRYCVKECPKKIDIPQVLKAINDYRIFEKPEYFDISYNLLSGATRAEDCVACGKCKEQCPQKIDIPFQMTEIRKFALEREIGINNHLIEDIQRKNKTIICFGCGEYGKRAIKYLKDYKIDRILLCDNKEDLWGKNINGYRVISPDRAVEMIKNEEAKMIITTRKFFDVIKKQFTEEGMTEADIMNY